MLQLDRPTEDVCIFSITSRLLHTHGSSTRMSDLEEELLGLAEDDPRARKRKNGGGGRKAKSSA